MHYNYTLNFIFNSMLTFIKRLLSTVSLSTLLAANLALGTASAVSTYSGINNTNFFADAVITSTPSGTTYERTTDASDSGTNDVTLGMGAGESLYIGFDEKFDGFSMDIGTSATGGTYRVDYWDGSTWDALTNGDDALENNGGTGVFSVDWSSRPSDWAQTTVSIDVMEDSSSGSSSSLYFVRMTLDSAYSTSAYADQIGILSYNLLLDLENELGSALTGNLGSFGITSGTADYTIYASEDRGSGNYAYAIYAPSDSNYTYTESVSGYVEESSGVTIGKSQTSLSLSLDYTQVIKAYDPDTGNLEDIDSASGGSSGTSCTISSGDAYCPIPTSEDGSSATVYSGGYAPSSLTLSNRTSDAQNQAVNSVTLDYAYIAIVEDEDGDRIEDADVEMGDDYYIDCENLGDGEYGCVVPTSEDDGEIRIDADGFDTETDNFNTKRNSNGDAQVRETFVLGDDDNDEPDLDVVSMTWDEDGDFKFTVENEGDEDVDEDETVYIYIYVDGDREWTESYNNDQADFFDAGEDQSFNLGDDFLDDDEDEHRVEVCIDATDTVNESDENNNCVEETLEQEGGNGGDEGVDLEVLDIYLDDDDLKFKVTNSGDEDVDSGESVKIYVYVDGDVEYTLVETQSSSSDNFLDEGETDIYSAGELLENEGDVYDVKVCVDATDTIDEDDEDNNCREEDEDELDEDPNGDSCGDFRDIDDHWAEEFICNLYERDVLEGISRYYFKPDDDTSRAEFLKIVLLGADLDTYEVDDVNYRDVDEDDWFYEYVTYATSRGYVEGFDDGYFRPNEDISRAEAVVILMRVAEEEKDKFDESDIDFWDVDQYDWFAEAVVLCDEFNIVEGYDDGSFRPAADLSRGEAAKIVDLAYEEFWN